jgi:hypothetical protein
MKKQIIAHTIAKISSRMDRRKGVKKCPKRSILICRLSFVRRDAPMNVIQSTISLAKGSLQSKLFKRVFAN